jgi:hypothetical protein
LRALVTERLTERRNRNSQGFYKVPSSIIRMSVIFWTTLACVSQLLLRLRAEPSFFPKNVSYEGQRNPALAQDKAGLSFGARVSSAPPRGLVRKASILAQDVVSKLNIQTESINYSSSQRYQDCRQTHNCHCDKYHRVGWHVCQKVDHLLSPLQSPNTRKRTSQL